MPQIKVLRTAVTLSFLMVVCFDDRSRIFSPFRERVEGRLKSLIGVWEVRILYDWIFTSTFGQLRSFFSLSVVYKGVTNTTEWGRKGLGGDVSFRETMLNSISCRRPNTSFTNSKYDLAPTLPPFTKEKPKKNKLRCILIFRFLLVVSIWYPGSEEGNETWEYENL